MLIILAVVIAVGALAFWIVGQLAFITAPWNNILRAIIALILVVWLLGYFLPGVLRLSH
jgi:hypothetical protein